MKRLLILTLFSVRAFGLFASVGNAPARAGFRAYSVQKRLPV
jgi:hypothetical protein